MLLSVQLPITIFALVYLTSSKKVMGKYANSKLGKIILVTIGTGRHGFKHRSADQFVSIKLYV
jgi:hypothetical protein